MLRFHVTRVMEELQLTLDRLGDNEKSVQSYVAAVLDSHFPESTATFAKLRLKNRIVCAWRNWRNSRPGVLLNSVPEGMGKIKSV